MQFWKAVIVGIEQWNYEILSTKRIFCYKKYRIYALKYRIYQVNK